MYAFPTANSEQSYRDVSHKPGLHLNVPQKKTCACCGITRNALTQFKPGSAVCHNCQRPR